jgi:hypothetical protein
MLPGTLRTQPECTSALSMTTPILERNCSDGVPTVGGSFGGEDAAATDACHICAQKVAVTKARTARLQISCLRQTARSGAHKHKQR